MKKILAFTLCLVFVFGSLMLGCGLFSSDSSSSAATLTGTTFYSTAQEAGPTITPTSLGTLGLQPNAIWENGNNLYNIYYMIRQYTYPNDEGVLDGSNIYKTLYDASVHYRTSLENCTEFDEKVVTASYDFGGDTITINYNCGYNTAFSENSNSYEYSNVVYSSASNTSDMRALVSTRIGEQNDTKFTHSTMQGQYSDESKDVTINLAYLVDYPSGEKYSVRLGIQGDTETGLFSLRLIKHNPGTGYSTSFASYGYSQGEGNYYLIKMDTSPSTSVYFCFESDTTQAEMQAMEDSGSGLVPTNCASYEANLPNNYDYDGADSPMALTDWVGGGDNGTQLNF